MEHSGRNVTGSGTREI